MSQVNAGAEASAFLQLSFSLRSGKRGTKCAAASFRLPLQVRARCGWTKSLAARPALGELTAKGLMKLHKKRRVTEQFLKKKFHFSPPGTVKGVSPYCFCRKLRPV